MKFLGRDQCSYKLSMKAYSKHWLFPAGSCGPGRVTLFVSATSSLNHKALTEKAWEDTIQGNRLDHASSRLETGIYNTVIPKSGHGRLRERWSFRKVLALVGLWLRKFLVFYVSGCLWEEVDRLFERWPQMEVGLYLLTRTVCLNYQLYMHISLYVDCWLFSDTMEARYLYNYAQSLELLDDDPLNNPESSLMDSC